MSTQGRTIPMPALPISSRLTTDYRDGTAMLCLCGLVSSRHQNNARRGNMAYTVIWNRACAQREEFIILGGASIHSRNTTGVFHTGAKKALVVYHKMGKTIVVCSSDDQGDYQYSISTDATPLGNIVVGHFANGDGEEIEQVRTTYTEDIASPAWISPIKLNPEAKAFGQFILNAVGTSPHSWGILQNVQEIEQPTPGFTRVYIPNNVVGHTVELVQNMDEYFCWKQTPIAEQDVVMDGHLLTVQLFERTGNFRNTVVFVQGAIAYHNDPMEHSYRYTYNVLDPTGYLLSEERELRSIAKFRDVLARAFSDAIIKDNAEMVKALIDALANAEGALYIWTNSDLLGTFFRDRYGQHASVVLRQHLAFVANVVRDAVGVLSSGMLWSLEKSGIPLSLDSGGIRGGRIEHQLTASQRHALEADIRLLEAAGLVCSEATQYFTFKNVNPLDGTVGWHERIDTGIHRIGLRSDIMDNETERRATILHEHRHIITKAGDTSNKFMDRADRDLARLAAILSERR